MYSIRYKMLITPALALALTGCTSFLKDQPTPRVTRIEWQTEIQAMLLPSVKGPLTIDEAIARALKYNLDRRAKQLEQEIAAGQLETTLQEMLPKASAQVTRSLRDKDRLTLGADYSPSSGPTSDKYHTTGDLGVSWSFLDFGLGYYNSKQAQNRVDIASERRRKLIQTLIQDVRSAYWRAACAQVMRDSLRQTIQEAESALEDSRKVEVERIKAPTEALAFQKQLLESLRLMEQIDQELSPAFVELAALINSPANQPLVLQPSWPELNIEKTRPLEQLEDMALEKNADLRESLLQTQIARHETRRVLTRLFPNITFSTVAKYDTDSYLVHQSWNEAGMMLSINLMNLFTGPAQMRLAEAGVTLANQRRMVTQMAVLTQVHLGMLNWQNAQKQAQRAEQIWNVDQKLATLATAREKALMKGKLETVNALASAQLSQFRRYQAIAQVHVAESRLRSVIGMEFDDISMDRMTLDELTQRVQKLPTLTSVLAQGEARSAQP